MACGNVIILVNAQPVIFNSTSLIMMMLLPNEVCESMIRTIAGGCCIE